MKRRCILFVAIAMLAGCADLELDQALNPAELAVKARSLLIEAARSPSPLLRSHAIEALAKSNERSAIQYILAGLNDDYWGVRFTTCMGLLEMRYAAGMGLLTEKVKDPNLSVRVAAVGALHVLGDPQYTSLLGRTLFDKDVVVRRNTALVLGRMGEEGAVRLLRRARRDDDISVRLQVTEAMAVLGSKKAQMLMVNYCRSYYDDEVALAMLALGQARCTEAAETIVTIFEQSNRANRIGMQLLAARALAMLGDHRGREAALRALRYHKGKPPDSARIRKLAALALAEMGDPKTLRPLQAGLTDSDPDVRIAAALAILMSLKK